MSVTPLFLDYGQHCVATEYETAMRVMPEEVARRLVRLDVSGIYADSHSRLIEEADLWTEHVTSADMYLPYRNLLFLSVGAAFAQCRSIGHVYAAFINSNHALEIDCSSEFFDRLGAMLVDYGSVRIEMPFREFEKREVVALGVELGVPVGVTYSCQISASTPCGACPNCVDRLEALSAVDNDAGPAADD